MINQIIISSLLKTCYKYFEIFACLDIHVALLHKEILDNTIVT